MTGIEAESCTIDGAEGRTEHRPRSKAETTAARLRALEAMDYAALRAEWRRLYRALPPRRVARDLLLLGVAWKIQEGAYGGLNAAAKRRLAALAKGPDADGTIRPYRAARLKPGARLLREWRGETHDVLVLEDGFQWRGRRWRSLSAIAREISGTHCSGPRFFGLQAKAGAGDERSLEAGSKAAGNG